MACFDFGFIDNTSSIMLGLLFVFLTSCCIVFCSASASCDYNWDGSCPKGVHVVFDEFLTRAIISGSSCFILLTAGILRVELTVHALLSRFLARGCSLARLLPSAFFEPTLGRPFTSCLQQGSTDCLWAVFSCQWGCLCAFHLTATERSFSLAQGLFLFPHTYSPAVS